MSPRGPRKSPSIPSSSSELSNTAGIIAVDGKEEGPPDDDDGGERRPDGPGEDTLILDVFLCDGVLVGNAEDARRLGESDLSRRLSNIVLSLC